MYLSRLPQHGVRLRLHALERVDEHHGAVRDAHGVGHLAAEINVACVCVRACVRACVRVYMRVRVCNARMDP
jgi:hypothetical protein